MSFDDFQTALVDVSTRIEAPGMDPTHAYSALLDSRIIPFGQRCVHTLLEGGAAGDPALVDPRDSKVHSRAWG
jgi:hypothetical protein